MLSQMNNSAQATKILSQHQANKLKQQEQISFNNIMEDQLVHFDKITDISKVEPSVAISHASLFAAIKHTKQRRKDKDQSPYINHPIGVAHTLLTLGELKPSQHDLAILSPEEWRRISKDNTRPLKPLAAVLAAILHDTIEDTETTFEELESVFGHVVASIVLECTDDKSLVKEERKQKQVDTAPFKSMEAKCVKLADKLYNLRDLIRCVPEGWTKERVQEYFSWAKRVINGCRGVLPKVEAELDNLFEHGTFKYQGQTFKCIP